MTFILIDRRKAGKGKSSANRQKLLKRIRASIKAAQPKNIGTGGVSGGNHSTSPVNVAGSALEEPRFVYSTDGEYTSVLIGNDRYDRGDELELDDDEEEGNGAGLGGGGEDDFIINIARDEFLDLFFEDCELPNLTHEKYVDRLENKFQQAGFSTVGNPAQLSVIRSFKQMVGRRRALTAPYSREAIALREEYDQLEDQINDLIAREAEDGRVNYSHLLARQEEIEDRLVVIARKIGALSGFDNVDLRYKKREAKPLKTVDAVLIMNMDISGSMDEKKKTIARRWFALLYAFIKRRYSNTELVFVAHTDEAYEMSEGDFFSTRMNGGTLASSSLKMINQIIKERYDPNQTNIYVCHASDGDNWPDDNRLVVDELVGQGALLRKTQFFCYVEVGEQRDMKTWSSGGKKVPGSDSNLWEAYAEAQTKAEKKLILSIIESPEDCYSVFKKIFKKGK